jgi:peptide/nickel transport system substrate-binding protein
VWTIKLRPGVTFHDGKPLTAADVIFTIQRIIDPKNPLEGSAGLSQVVPSGLKAVDDLTVQVTLKSPNVVFEQVLAQPWHYIVPTNYNPRRPVGTGAFKFKSFVPGQESVFVKNENYWQTGLPYVDKVIITDFTDSTSQANALLGGQVDLIDQITGAGVDAVKSSSTSLSISPSGAWEPITMRVDVAPFNDVRVRQAMRLLVDRTQMVENVLGGYGSVGNDLFARWDPDYDSSLPQRETDVDQAKSLLKKAGHEGMTISIVTAPIAGDVTGEAQVFAQQAKAAGVNMSVEQTTVDTFFGKSYLSWKLAQDWYTYFPYLNQVSQSMLPISPFNETHWDNATYNSLYSSALRETDAAKRKDLVHEMQTIEWNEGGYIVPYFVDAIGAHGTGVSGIQPTKTGIPFNNYNLKQMWLA